MNTNLWRILHWLAFWIWPIFRVLDMVVSTWILFDVVDNRDANMREASLLVRQSATKALLMIVISVVVGIFLPFLFLYPLVNITGWRPGAFVLIILCLGYLTDTKSFRNFMTSGTYIRTVLAYTSQSLLQGIFWGIVLVSKYMM